MAGRIGLRVGKPVDAAGRDTGNTTGVATAVLALLSAGTLATLGLVTTSDLRGLGPVNPGGGTTAVAPPSLVVVPPGPSRHPRPRAGGSTGGPSAFPFQPPVPIQSLVPARPGGVPGAVPPGAAPSPSAQGPGVPLAPDVPVVPPTPEPGAQPVLSGVIPEPVPQVNVLAEKKGRHPHPDTPRGRARRPQPPPPPAAPPWSAAVIGPHGRPRATTAHPHPTATPSVEPTVSTPTAKPTQAHPSAHPTQAHPSAKPTQAQPPAHPTRSHPSAKPTQSHGQEHASGHRTAPRDHVDTTPTQPPAYPTRRTDRDDAKAAKASTPPAERRHGREASHRRESERSAPAADAARRGHQGPDRAEAHGQDRAPRHRRH